MKKLCLKTGDKSNGQKADNVCDKTLDKTQSGDYIVCRPVYNGTPGGAARSDSNSGRGGGG